MARRVGGVTYREAVKLGRPAFVTLLSAALIAMAVGASAPAQAVVPRVINGDPPGALTPAAVALEIDDTPDTSEGCTGTLWRPRIIITAAHCVSVGETQNLVDPKVISVWAPGANQNKDNALDVNVTTMYVPQGWQTHTGNAAGDYDIAFLVTDKPVGTPLWTRMATVDEAVALARASTRLDYVGYGTTAARSNTTVPAPDFALHVSEALDPNPGANPSTLDTRGDLVHSTCAGDSGGPWLATIAGQLVLVGIEASGWGAPCDAPSEDGTSGATMTLAAAFPDLAARALADVGDSATAAPKACVTWRGDKPECVSGAVWSTQACIVAPTVTLDQRTASGWQRVSGATVKRDVRSCGSRNRYLLTVTGTVGAGSTGYRVVLPKQKGLRTAVQYLFTVSAA